MDRFRFDSRLCFTPLATRLPVLLAVAALSLLSACSTHEPGPAERIGKSLDEMTDAIGDMTTPSEEDRERAKRRAEDDEYWRQRDEEEYRRKNEGFNRPYSEPQRYDPDYRRDSGYPDNSSRPGSDSRNSPEQRNQGSDSDRY